MGEEDPWGLSPRTRGTGHRALRVPVSPRPRVIRLSHGDRFTKQPGGKIFGKTLSEELAGIIEHDQIVSDCPSSAILPDEDCKAYRLLKTLGTS